MLFVINFIINNFIGLPCRRQTGSSTAASPTVMRYCSYTILSLLVIIILSCKNGSTSSKTLERVDSLIIPVDSNSIYLTYPLHADKQPKRYFPIDIKKSDSDEIQWNSYLLYRFREPLLNSYIGKTDIYRFTWSRTFHSPLCIRIENNKGEVKLIAKELSGQGGYSIGQIAFDSTVYLTAEKWDVFISLLHETKFWEMPSTNYDDIFGLDGATWLMEGNKNKKYHWIARWSPGKNSSFGKACQYLVSVSPIAIDPQQIY